jgi:hypothetical protein
VTTRLLVREPHSFQVHNWSPPLSGRHSAVASLALEPWKGVSSVFQSPCQSTWCSTCNPYCLLSGELPVTSVCQTFLHPKAACPCAGCCGPWSFPATSAPKARPEHRCQILSPPPSGCVFQPLPGGWTGGSLTASPEGSAREHPPFAGSAVGDYCAPAAGVPGW